MAKAKEEFGIGSKVRYTRTDRKGNTRVVEGVVTGRRPSRGMLVDINTGVGRVAEQFRIKPNDGSRAFWSDPVLPAKR